MAGIDGATRFFWIFWIFWIFWVPEHDALVRFPLAEADVHLFRTGLGSEASEAFLFSFSFSSLTHNAHNALGAPLPCPRCRLVWVLLVTCFRSTQANILLLANIVCRRTRFGLHRTDWGFWPLIRFLGEKRGHACGHTFHFSCSALAASVVCDWDTGAPDLARKGRVVEVGR